MKYYLIVGEASGDLHASNLMRALQQEDAQAEFRFFGGDLMQSVGGTLVRHYKEMAYMGFIPVLLHLRTIFRNMEQCRQDMLAYRPDVLILVDYPGFNLKMAKFAHEQGIRTFYYISPKIWAWKEHRIKEIKAYVDELFSILPFEVDFFRKHQYPVHYVGNPCVDAVMDFRQQYAESREAFLTRHQCDTQRPIIALLAGSRKQEIKDNLPKMIRAARAFPHYQIIIAGAPGIEPSYYDSYTSADIQIVYGETYALLEHATAALVTSGTATLETALFSVPQVVCYHTPVGRIASWLRKCFIKVPYISLVNLIAQREVVPELVAHLMTVENMQKALRDILPDGTERERMLQGYAEIQTMLGTENASARTAQMMLKVLRGK